MAFAWTVHFKLETQQSRFILTLRTKVKDASGITEEEHSFQKLEDLLLFEPFVKAVSEACFGL